MRNLETTGQLAIFLGLSLAEKSRPILKVRVHSAEICPGDLFVATRGEKVDGHNFLESAAKNGALSALVSIEYLGPDYGLTLLRVPDVVEGLQKIAAALIRARAPYIIGVTGSVGKTTTKEFIYTLLSGKFVTDKSPGSLNSQIGLPLAIIGMNPRAQVIVLEMSMSGPGHLKKLVEMAPPDFAVLTRIGHSHFEFFKSQEELASAKSEIFTSKNLKNSLVHASNLRFNAVPKEGECYSLEEGGAFSELKIPFDARHLRENFIAAARVASHLGVCFQEICDRAHLLCLEKNRFERVECRGIQVVNDSYNAAPDSTLAALAALPVPKNGGKRLFVFGSMKELGAFSEQAHQMVASAALPLIDELHCIGAECAVAKDFFHKNGRMATLYGSYEELAESVKKRVVSGDTLLIKGSNSHRLWRLVDALQTPL